ncbi:hypothetical protein [Celeribacter marinus]|uniref:Uncharacterized protein n=1 Tax=Celeribacter marinus TaxID=1397108 RepID=A0A0N9ZDI6_9RHOB|nr:hypothetical protein [Celeribacter marinus]ALI54842.1 hypothetical protein IMCC12053_894 [Celeribacter marinus]SFJ99766.1 hypothetical protein SAMN05444421_10155 [Celeribacter marinus]
MSSNFILILASLAAMVTTASVAAPSDAVQVVEIPVSAADLELCVATLAAVFVPPVQDAAVLPASGRGSISPTVVCVVDDNAS